MLAELKPDYEAHDSPQGLPSPIQRHLMLGTEKQGGSPGCCLCGGKGPHSLISELGGDQPSPQCPVQPPGAV